MPHFVGQVQFLNSVIYIPLARFILLPYLFMLNRECAVLQVKFLKVKLDLSQLVLEFVNSFLAFFLNLAEPNDFTLALLELDVELVYLSDQSAAFLFINFL